MNKQAVCAAALFFTLCAGTAPAQSSSTSGTELVSTQFDTTGFPHWAKDLRPGEIVAFGSFPFAYFFTHIIHDTYRTATHNWDRRYAPWPLKAAGAVELTQKEQFVTLGIAAGGAVLIAVADHLIVRYKRNKQQREIRNLPEGTPIIIRRPMEEKTEEAGASGEGVAEEPAAESGSP